ncbi:MAG: tyrosine-protein phosphatase [Oscillospiraceae bacterium]
MIDIGLKGAKNIRDLGGTICSDGRIIKPRRFIRGAELSRITPADMHTLTEYCRVKTIIDLRTDKEIEEKPDPRMEGTSLFKNPIVEAATMGISHEKGTNSARGLARVPLMEELYRNIIRSDYSQEQLAKALHLILDNTESGAVLWHCTVGKDRCGILSALVLFILGADMDTIYKDYLLTNRVGQLRSSLCYVLAHIITANNKATAKRVLGIYTARRSFLEAAFDEMEKIAGSVEEFIRTNLQFSDGDIEQMRAAAFN